MKQFKFYYPLEPFSITQKFGENLSPIYAQLGLKGHTGWDAVRRDNKGNFLAVTGANVRAAHNGEITHAGADGATGYIVVVRTTEQFLDISGNPYYWKTVYAHLLPNIPVKVGMKVKVGDIIGYADTTGYATGPHLHLTIKPIYQGESDWIWANVEQNNGYLGAVDPTPYSAGQSAYNVMTAGQKLKQLWPWIYEKYYLPNI